jgi:hypothetical protein
MIQILMIHISDGESTDETENETPRLITNVGL